MNEYHSETQIRSSLINTIYEDIEGILLLLNGCITDEEEYLNK